MKPSQILILSALIIGFLTGIIVKGGFDKNDSNVNQADEQTLILSGDHSGSERPDINQFSSDISKLQHLLKEEITAHKLLEEKLETLNQKVAALDMNTQLANIGLSAEIDNEEQTQAANLEENWFNETALTDSGMSSSQAAELKSFFEQQELERMYLRDQSIRENWSRRKFRDEIQRLTEQGDAFLSQLDNSAYDAYLYASQQPNRVQVMSVLDSSQAGTAGIQPGDHIIRYDNKRIYNGFALRNATSDGDIDESIAVEVERDGQILEFYLSRGPLGIRMNSVSVKP